ncbi:MAG: CCA tRNA nucleotidyltransferase [Candidatus Aenigmatarchaeota archaeon]
MWLKEVLKEIKPSKKEEDEVKSFTSKLIKIASKFSKPLLCGSIEKNTWLTKKNEVDLFLLFKPSLSKNQLEKKGLAIAKKIVKKLKGSYVIAYAEHPYLKAKIGKFNVDIVPCYEIKNPENIKSAVDRTPFHVKFVKENLKNPDEVRLLKQFCIANKCYGADLKTQGFSGYLCELLIIKFGSFNKLVKDACKWRVGHVVSFIEVNKNEVFKKFKTPLIVIDPVDKNRNVAAAVSAESFYKFVKACKNFVKKPSKEFFFETKVKPYSINEIKKEIKKRGTRWYLIAVKKPDVLEDILYPQLRKCIKAFNKLLEQNGFKVLRSNFYCNKECILVFEMETWQVPKIMKNIGPDIYSKHAEQFLKHYKEQKVFIEGENWVAETEREITTVLHFLKNLVKKPEKELLEKGIPNKVAPLLKECKVYGGSEALKAIEKMSEDFRIFLKEWFEKDLNVV